MGVVVGLEEKRKNFNHFMRSKEFTLTTFSYLSLLSHNIGFISKLVRLHGLFYSRLENDDQSVLSDESARAMKHFIHLDALSKVMMMLETLFGLALALLGEYKDVPRKMMVYDQKRIDGLVRKLMQDTLTTEEIWRIIGFPSLDRLHLSPVERETISKILVKSASDVREFLRRLAQFYVDHKSAYNRFKHGFSIIAGFESSDDQVGLAMVFDRKRRLQGRFFRVTEGIRLEGFDWFNVINLVPDSQQAFNYYQEIADLAASMYLHIARNHLDYAYNLGEDYFPQAVISKQGIPEGDLKAASMTLDRLRSNTYHIEKPLFRVILNFKGDKVTKVRAAFADSQIATLFVLTTDDIKKSVEEYRRKQKIFDEETALTIVDKLDKGKAAAENMVGLVDYVQKSTCMDEEVRDDLLLKLRCVMEEPFRFDGNLKIEHKTDTGQEIS
jgi:hypothetical protein